MIAASTADRGAPGGALLSARGVEKRYPGVHALKGVDLDIHAGEVHALLGSNGAGKSTLARIFGGVEAPDAGEVLFDGSSLLGLRPDEVAARGLAVVHQELRLFPDLSVEENLAFLVGYPTSHGFAARGRIHRQALDALRVLGHREIDPRAQVADISVAEAWLVSVSAALVREPRLLLLDESTAAMSARDATVLFDFLRERAAAGLAVILVSHRLQEVRDGADRITILRDGRIGETVPSSTSRSRLIEIMFGEGSREAQEQRERTAVADAAAADADGAAIRVTRTDAAPADGPPLLQVVDLHAGSARGVSFEVRPGEVLGIAGAVGSGRTSTARAIAGELPLQSGSLLLDGRTYRPRNPAEAVRRGVVLLPEDRDANGVMPGMSLRENISIGVIDDVGRGPLVARRAERGMAASVIADLNIKGVPGQEITTLSGGNRQKALLGRARCIGARLLVLDEPTRGLDFAARGDLEATIRSFAEAGNGVVVISSEFDELATLATRVIAIRDGESVDFELRDPHSSDEGAIAQASYGGQSA
ncbi:sugar ABC transporter ATP-binding protein [Conexibacter sp. CPCC 206217]|uniref:sugar ABC transporter ATP-binding protein n=1 Tax=Conexibacter sp. CPCC 206217 TaxID=3064574 RepID=UPI00271C7CF9|nr:sugar ABC transporter ATP-binding protein [Conexibacter sp. CPCC 206217]MDO8211650.1 sugar ABC transporter ATP-binding protein [Conexibacter sp. CPCC 206217]